MFALYCPVDFNKLNDDDDDDDLSVLCTASVHNTKQNSSNNLSSYLQTTIIAQMLSIGGEGAPLQDLCWWLIMINNDTNVRQKATRQIYTNPLRNGGCVTLDINVSDTPLCGRLRDQRRRLL